MTGEIPLSCCAWGLLPPPPRGEGGEQKITSLLVHTGWRKGLWWWLENPKGGDSHRPLNGVLLRVAGAGLHQNISFGRYTRYSGIFVTGPIYIICIIAYLPMDIRIYIHMYAPHVSHRGCFAPNSSHSWFHYNIYGLAIIEASLYVYGNAPYTHHSSTEKKNQLADSFHPLHLLLGLVPMHESLLQ